MPKVSLNRLISNPLSLTNSATLILVPKSVSLISRLPIFDLQKSLLNKMLKICQQKIREFYISVMFSLLRLSEGDIEIAFIKY